MLSFFFPYPEEKLTPASQPKFAFLFIFQNVKYDFFAFLKWL